MTVFVDPEDPAKFIQKVSGKAPDFDVVSADGTVSNCRSMSQLWTGNKNSRTGHSERLYFPTGKTMGSGQIHLRMEFPESALQSDATRLIASRKWRCQVALMSPMNTASMR